MANWCNNYAIFVHPDADYVAAIVDEFNISPLSDDREARPFNMIHPNPHEPDTEEYVDWNIENWGVKWEPEVLKVEYDSQYNPNKLKVSFVTGWGPPIDLYEYMVSDDWDVEAMYHESVGQFVGQFKEGQDFFYEYDLSKGDKFLTEIPEELVLYGKLEEELNLYKVQIQNNSLKSDVDDDEFDEG